FSVLSGALITSCAGGMRDNASAPRITRTDSAGVEIVTTETPAAEVPVFATLDTVPGLRLGSLSGPEEEQFGSVRDLAVLSDGGVAVLDGQAVEIRVFGPDGSFRRTVGRKGEGPGELSWPSYMTALAGDSLAVWDSRGGRVTVFAPDGSLGRVTPVAFDGYGRPFVVSFFADGSMVGQSRWNAGSFSGGEQPAFRLDSAVLVVNTADGALVDTMGVFPGSETVQSMHRSGDMVTMMMASTRFGRSLQFAAHPEGVWAGFGDHFELHLHDAADGHVKRILRAPGLDAPLTDAEVAEIEAEAMEEAENPDQRQRAQSVNDLSARPELRPAYDALVVDDHGRLWLRRWEGTTPETLRWWVFGPDAALLGYVDLPGRFRLEEVRNGQAWGVARDELDVSYVVRYRLNPPSS
ncbi:MAG: hypothetical protein LJF04_05530, partial [Gemmatimonadetes bacterium]|nr:hypothetical protein [Gemmatimonadota bacterium]